MLLFGFMSRKGERGIAAVLERPPLFPYPQQRTRNKSINEPRTLKQEESNLSPVDS